MLMALQYNNLSIALFSMNALIIIGAVKSITTLLISAVNAASFSNIQFKI